MFPKKFRWFVWPVTFMFCFASHVLTYNSGNTYLINHGPCEYQLFTQLIISFMWGSVLGKLLTELLFNRVEQ